MGNVTSSVVSLVSAIASDSLASAEASASLALAEASAHKWNYEVFLSFRGVDTREGITSAIFDGLQNMREVKTFMDGQKIQVGDNIAPTLLTAIKESRFAIVVLSQHYADSTWCLEELTTILQCMKDKNRILPLFYKVDPSDVRYQKGSFGDAFTKHESRHGIGKVKQWKDALRNVASLSGWDSNNYHRLMTLRRDQIIFVGLSPPLLASKNGPVSSGLSLLCSLAAIDTCVLGYGFFKETK